MNENCMIDAANGSARAAGRREWMGLAVLALPTLLLPLAAILPAIYGLKELASNGWEASPALAVVVGVVFGVAFLWQ